ncbi:lipocalin-like domain-containing protein [Streptomyces sp. NBC_01318]|uniref:lipocalin-like domain-containing protein n=1 Tax=unclassified Streptomyces TaxID=2593676 RepID=UPI002DD8993A|nr:MULTISPECIES: lipocalin-like domain-containing protein [unclassified Streptomyces]WSD28549.1 lipocalin-like domain-containing protein [Streptomyces sp. NBC_01751]WSJ49449.1 lipocalin-like domain-containing protein [Streptomyces sp. NBC_01318]
MTPDELRAALIGTWRLVSYEATAVDDGEVVRPYGEHPLGLIMYTSDGYMSAQITTPHRPLFEEERQEYGSPEELAEAARHYLAYTGSFRVPDGDTVVHEVTLYLYPNWMGNGQTRVVRLDGRTLQLAPPTPLSVGARQRTGVLTWERAEPH